MNLNNYVNFVKNLCFKDLILLYIEVEYGRWHYPTQISFLKVAWHTMLHDKTTKQGTLLYLVLSCSNKEILDLD